MQLLMRKPVGGGPPTTEDVAEVEPGLMKQESSEKVMKFQSSKMGQICVYLFANLVTIYVVPTKLCISAKHSF